MAKNSQVMTNRRQQPPAERMRAWWQETRGELRKVTWPTPEQTRNLTLVVVAFCIVMATFLGVVDLILSQIVKLIVGI
jgi:preprotein translocase subunit SecE